MNKLKVTTTAVLLGLALSTSVIAQQLQEEFPKERTQTGTCENFDWNKKMLIEHPSLIKACQEAVIVNDETWARFAAKFVKVQPDGNVVFSVQDKQNREAEQVVIVPAAGQVAYIEDKATPFSDLRTTDNINLYVPEGQYGFATKAGAPPERVATVVNPAPVTVAAKTTPKDASNDKMLAQRDTTPRVLPATASSLPWFALTGILSLLGGMVLTLRRWS